MNPPWNPGEVRFHDALHWSVVFLLKNQNWSTHIGFRVHSLNLLLAVTGAIGMNIAAIVALHSPCAVLQYHEHEHPVPHKKCKQ